MVTRQLLINHYKKYPALQIKDLFKFLYQSTFGCEHLLCNEEKAIDYIKEEYIECGKVFIEALDGDYTRVSLGFLDEGLTAETFGRLFSLSAKEEKGSIDDLLKKLEILRELIIENALPFTLEEFEKEIKEWEKEEFSPIHHSEEFRASYKPSYRLIHNKFIPFLPLFIEIDKRLKSGKLTLAIEGGSASGKSTLCKILSSIYDSAVFHIDDFFLQEHQRTPERYKQIGGNLDRERFLSEVLIPLKNNDSINYRRFDCGKMKILDGIEIRPKKLNIIEGAYSMHKELQEFYDLSIFLDIDKESQRERILIRNPQLSSMFFDKWIPMEEIYFKEWDIKNTCDMVINVK